MVGTFKPKRNVGLDYFSIPPILSFEVNSPQYWIALGAFEFTALVITRLAYVANLRAVEAIAVRRDTERLYETARRILLFDRSQEPGSLLASLIQDVFQLAEVVLFDAITVTPSSTRFRNRRSISGSA